MNSVANLTTFDPAESSRIDLDAYFERIGYAGHRTPTLDTLRAIPARHPAAIPLENLNPPPGWPVRLDAESLPRKLVGDGWGGCSALGFSVTGPARVVWNRPADAVTPRSHMLLRILLDRVDYLGDVGSGGSTLTGPLRLKPDSEQATPHEPVRLSRAGGDLVMHVRIREGARAPQHRAGRPSFRRTTERRALTTAAVLRDTLEDTVRLRVPERPEVGAAFERLTSYPSAAVTT
ncbi:MAG: arylamine N-acetyltransferase family protein [Gemmatimonadales bacterium]